MTANTPSGKPSEESIKEAEAIYRQVMRDLEIHDADGEADYAPIAQALDKYKADNGRLFERMNEYKTEWENACERLRNSEDEISALKAQVKEKDERLAYFDGFELPEDGVVLRIKDLKTKLSKAREALVNAAIPLEAFVISQTPMTPLAQKEVKNGIEKIREVLEQIGEE